MGYACDDCLHHGSRPLVGAQPPEWVDARRKQVRPIMVILRPHGGHAWALQGGVQCQQLAVTAQDERATQPRVDRNRVGAVEGG